MASRLAAAAAAAASSRPPVSRLVSGLAGRYWPEKMKLEDARNSMIKGYRGYRHFSSGAEDPIYKSKAEMGMWDRFKNRIANSKYADMVK